MVGGEAGATGEEVEQDDMRAAAESAAASMRDVLRFMVFGSWRDNCSDFEKRQVKGEADSEGYLARSQESTRLLTNQTEAMR